MGEIESLICVKHGGNPIGVSNFYMANEVSIYGGIGYIPICKRCLYEEMEKYYDKYKDMEIAVYCMCRLVDVGFNFSHCDAAIKNGENDARKTIQYYIGKYNSLGGINNIQTSFDNGEHIKESQCNTECEDSNKVKTTTDEFKVEKDTKVFWGDGFEDRDYLFLELELANWQKTHKCDNQAEITLLKEICIKILGIRKSRTMKESVSKELKELQDLMKTASVDPAKANVADSGKSLDTYGLWVKDIERNEPAEFFDDKEMFKDYDGIKKYTDKYIYRPLKNLLTGSRDFDVEKYEDGDK